MRLRLVFLTVFVIAGCGLGYELVAGLSAERSERYHEASRLANRYCGWLEARYLKRRRHDALAREARRFWRLGQREKLETIATLTG